MSLQPLPEGWLHRLKCTPCMGTEWTLRSMLVSAFMCAVFSDAGLSDMHCSDLLVYYPWSDCRPESGPKGAGGLL